MTLLPGLSLGMKGHARLIVGPAHTAIALGSGRSPVFATPTMVALMEAAAVDCIERGLEPGTTSLGTRIAVSHDAATPPGLEVEATAELTQISGRTLEFRVEARDPAGAIGSGQHTRIVVDKARFEKKTAARGKTG